MQPLKEPPQEEKAPSFLSLSQVQVYLGIKSRKTVLKYIRTGKLRAYKIGGTRWRIARKDVNQFLEEHRGGKVPVSEWSQVAS